MYQQFVRPLTDGERKIFEDDVVDRGPPISLADTLKWLAICTTGLLFCGLAAFLPMALGANPIVGGIAAGIFGMAGILCLYGGIATINGYFHWRNVYRNVRRDDVPEMLAALEDGMAVVKKVMATAVIEIEELDDEGPGYIFDVGDGKLLFLKGQRYFPIHDDREWPNTDFEIVRAVHGDRWIGIFCHGEAMEPLKVISMADCKDEIVRDDREELVDGEINGFVQSLLRQP